MMVEIAASLIEGLSQRDVVLASETESRRVADIIGGTIGSCLVSRVVRAQMLHPPPLD